VTTPVRILGAGAAVPSLRLPAAEVAAAWGAKGGRGQAAVCAPDEDVLTLSWQAAEDAMAAAGVGHDEVDALFWGTSRPPFAEGPSHSMLAGVLRLRSDAGGLLASGSTHSGMEALLAAWDAVAAGSARVALVVAADALVPGLGSSLELRAGAGAAALVLSADGGTAGLQARATWFEPILDRHRGDSHDATQDLYDPRLFREEVFLPVVTEVGRKLATEAGDIRAWALPDPDGRLGGAVAKKLGADTKVADAVTAFLGETGAAMALLGLVASLVEPGTVAAIAYGGGRTTGVTVDVETPVPGASALAPALSTGRFASYPEALRARGQLVASGTPVPMGVPPGSAGFVRGAHEMLELLGARCVECGTVNVPPTIHPACINCGNDKFEIQELARKGTVHTFVVNHTMPAPFVAPLPLCVIDLEDGTRVMLQGTADDAASLQIGDTVHLLLRRYAVERGVPVYGFKAKKEVVAA
jgi:hydroxymethylglutaryl-CoA synthase